MHRMEKSSFQCLALRRKDSVLSNSIISALSNWERSGTSFWKQAGDGESTVLFRQTG